MKKGDAKEKETTNNKKERMNEIKKERSLRNQRLNSRIPNGCN